MRTIEVKLYKFSELSDKAKDRAISDYRASDTEYHFWHDNFDSLKVFADFFNVKIVKYEVGTCSYSYVETDADNSHFRGKRLAQFDRDNMPTGYCADCSLWMAFYDSFKKSGDAKQAFNDAIDNWVSDTVKEMEHQSSDEAITESIECNEYEFDEKGAMV